MSAPGADIRQWGTKHKVMASLAICMMRPTNLVLDGSINTHQNFYKLSRVRYLGRELDGELARYLRREIERENRKQDDPIC